MIILLIIWSPPENFLAVILTLAEKSEAEEFSLPTYI
jgi:hypothetical protein